MATKTLYVLNTAAASPYFWGNLQEGGTAPAGALCTYGYNVGIAGSSYWRSYLGASLPGDTKDISQSYLTYPPSMFGGVVVPVPPKKGLGTGIQDGVSAAGDSFMAGPFSGTFAAGVWTFSFKFATPVPTAKGYVRCAVWHGPTPDGAGASRLIGLRDGSEVTLDTANVAGTSTITVNVPQLKLYNDYLFFQVEWYVTEAGTDAGCVVKHYQGGTIVTTDFVATTFPALRYVYEPHYYLSGWFSDDGLSMASWWDRDLSQSVSGIDGGLIPLNELVATDAAFLLDDDVFFSGPDGPVQLPPGADGRPRPMLPAQDQPHITVELLPGFFSDEDLFFIPMAIRALDTPDKMLKNEVIRTR